MTNYSAIIDAGAYPVHIGEQALSELEKILEEIELSGTNVFLLADQNTAHYCLPRLHEKIHMPENMKEYIIPAGESGKNLEVASLIWNWLTEHKAGRDSMLICLGGGLITDLGGFVAAAYKRGMRYINLPTSLLAMVDASIGGKVGLNFNGLKNHIGFFYPPEAVLIWPGFLTSLPDVQLRSAYAEMIKHALLKDESSWEDILNFKVEEIQSHPELILKSILVKLSYVKDDPNDKGKRKALNFGHTVGHALESFSQKNGRLHLLHGEAVAAGLICETWLSQKVAALSPRIYEQVSQFLVEKFGVYHLEEKDLDEISGYMEQDKKNIGGSILFSLLEDIGKPLIGQPASIDLIKDSLNIYRKI